jgi:lysophospholipase L1-like esterase
MAYQFNNEVLNAILLDLGVTTTYPQDIDALNAILLQLGGTGGHHYMIDAYNELCTIQSVSSNHYYLIDALNAINIGGGGTDERFELPALVQLGTKVNPFIPLINDGNTVAFYDAMDLTTITKDGSNVVSRLNDKLGSGHDLVTGACSWDAQEGLIFNGTTHYLKTASFTFGEPETIFLILKNIVWGGDQIIFDGNTTNSGTLLQHYGTSNHISMVIGAYTPEETNNRNYVWQLVKVTFNGAASKIQIWGFDEHTGNPGTAAMNGFTLARYGAHALDFGNIGILQAILRKTAEDATNTDIIFKEMLKAFDGEFLFIGDSITQKMDFSYVNDMQNRWVGDKVPYLRNYAVSGAFVMPQVSHNDLETQIELSKDVKCSRIWVAMGMNDNIADVNAIEAVYKANIEQLKAHHPTATIYCQGIIPTTRNAGADAAAINPKLKLAAESILGVTFYETTGWIDAATETIDGIHPTAGGHAKIATEVLSRINV